MVTETLCSRQHNKFLWKFPLLSANYRRGDKKPTIKVISKELTSSMADKGQVLCADDIMGLWGRRNKPYVCEGQKQDASFGN